MKHFLIILMVVMLFVGCSMVDGDYSTYDAEPVLVLDKWIDLPDYYVSFRSLNTQEERTNSVEAWQWTNANIGAETYFTGW